MDMAGACQLSSQDYWFETAYEMEVCVCPSPPIIIITATIPSVYWLLALLYCTDLAISKFCNMDHFIARQRTHFLHANDVTFMKILE